jgi:hypothetical protein
MRQKKIDRIKRMEQRRKTTPEERLNRAKEYNKAHGMPEPREGK